MILDQLQCAICQTRKMRISLDENGICKDCNKAVKAKGAEITKGHEHLRGSLYKLGQDVLAEYYRKLEESDSLPIMERFKVRVTDAVKFNKQYLRYWRENAPEVFDEDGEVDPEKLGNYTSNILMDMILERRKITEFEKIMICFLGENREAICLVCDKSMGKFVKLLNEMHGPQICEKCIHKPEIIQLLRVIDPDEMVYWRPSLE